MVRTLALLFLLVPSIATAVVIRHDVDDSKYRVPASELPALVDLPGEGHGVLIAPKWVLTAAHAVTWQHAVDEVVINGRARKVQRLVIHPGYRKLPQPLVDDALASGDAGPIIDHLAFSDDVALIELAEPLADVGPLAMFTDAPSVDTMVKIIGKGATGTGEHGHDPHGPNGTELRRAFNRLAFIEDRWLAYVFDQGAAALPLEGMGGNGDSGGPLLVQVGDEWQVAGLAAWKRGSDNGIILRPGAYGQRSYNVRVGHYADWIASIVGE